MNETWLKENYLRLYQQASRETAKEPIGGDTALLRFAQLLLIEVDENSLENLGL